MDLQPIAPIGTRAVDGVETFGHVGRWSEPVYPDPCPEAVALRRLREQLGFPLRLAARALGLLPSQLADLERGRARPAPPTPWTELLATLWDAGGDRRPLVTSQAPVPAHSRSAPSPPPR